MFSVGAIGYGFIEILWRGYTHWSMVIAGGISFLGIFKISERLKKCSLFTKALAGCGFITTVEYIFGVIFNIILKQLYLPLTCPLWRLLKPMPTATV